MQTFNKKVIDYIYRYTNNFLLYLMRKSRFKQIYDIFVYKPIDSYYKFLSEKSKEEIMVINVFLIPVLSVMVPEYLLVYMVYYPVLLFNIIKQKKFNKKKRIIN